jgi:hypothetical protein
MMEPVPTCCICHHWAELRIEVIDDRFCEGEGRLFVDACLPHRLDAFLYLLTVEGPRRGRTDFPITQEARRAF